MEAGGVTPPSSPHEFTRRFCVGGRRHVDVAGFALHRRHVRASILRGSITERLSPPWLQLLLLLLLLHLLLAARNMQRIVGDK